MLVRIILNQKFQEVLDTRLQKLTGMQKERVRSNLIFSTFYI